jgi:uncharacterized protein (DUF1501 family)
MKRRSFIKNSAFVSVPLIINGNAISAFAKSTFAPPFQEQSDKILVLIQLDGGNDGLNTVLPVDQYDKLYNLRSNIIIPENKILSINDNLGFHPSMMAMHELYQEGQLKIIQNVGYPTPNRSHFRSTDIWTSGSPSQESWTTGWMGRYFESMYPGFPEAYPNEIQTDPFAITIASRVSETCQGISSNFSMAVTNPDNLSGLDQGNEDVVPNTPYGYELTFLRNAIAQTNAYGEVVSKAASSGSNAGTAYPEGNPLAQQLKIVAKLIAGGLQTSVYVVRMGGYDTHANQVESEDPTIGNHANLLKELSDAIFAFQDDIGKLGLGKKVLGMTFTEFGRQIKSNESLGTDHGEAGPMFLFGDCLDTQILGDNPNIPDSPEVREALPFQIDFRDVYGSVLKDWYNLSEGNVKDLLHPDFIKLDLLDGCGLTRNKNTHIPGPELNISPNPFMDSWNISIKTESEYLKIELYNNLGQKVDTVVNRNTQPGIHNFKVDSSNYKSGIYYCRVDLNGKIKTIKLIRK